MSATPAPSSVAGVRNTDIEQPFIFKPLARSEKIGSLVAAIASVMKQLAAIPKTPAKSSAGQGLPYEYLSEDAITSTLRPLMAEAGLVIFPQGGQVVEREDYEAGRSNMTRLLMRQRFLIGHNSGEWVECETWGEAADSGDKGANKCMTAAFKYLERQTFMVNGGADPDERHGDDVARTGRGYAPAGNQNRQAAGGQQTGNQTRAGGQTNNQQQNRQGNQNTAAGGGQQGDPAFPGGNGTEERAGKCMAAIAAAVTHEKVNQLIDHAKTVKWTTDQQNRIRRSAAAQRVALWSAEIAVAPTEEAVNAIQTASAGPLGAFPELAQLVTVKARHRNAEHAAARAQAEATPDTGGASSEAPFSDVPVSEMEF